MNLEKPESEVPRQLRFSASSVTQKTNCVNSSFRYFQIKFCFSIALECYLFVECHLIMLWFYNSESLHSLHSVYKQSDNFCLVSYAAFKAYHGSTSTSNPLMLCFFFKAY